VTQDCLDWKVRQARPVVTPSRVRWVRRASQARDTPVRQGGPGCLAWTACRASRARRALMGRPDHLVGLQTVRWDHPGRLDGTARKEDLETEDDQAHPAILEPKVSYSACFLIF